MFRTSMGKIENYLTLLTEVKDSKEIYHVHAVEDSVKGINSPKTDLYIHRYTLNESLSELPSPTQKCCN